MRSDKTLFHIQFGDHNSLASVYKAMTRAFDVQDQWVSFNKYTYLVYTDKTAKDVQVMVGVNMIDDIDDFIIMELNYEAAMSTFTDRNDVIAFLLSIKGDSDLPDGKPTQEVVDALLDKVMDCGPEGLSERELTMLRRF